MGVEIIRIKAVLSSTGLELELSLAKTKQSENTFDYFIYLIRRLKTLSCKPAEISICILLVSTPCPCSWYIVVNHVILGTDQQVASTTTHLPVMRIPASQTH